MVLKDEVWFKVSFDNGKVSKFACICHNWFITSLQSLNHLENGNIYSWLRTINILLQIKAQFRARDHKLLIWERLLAEAGWGFGHSSTLRSVWKMIRLCSSLPFSPWRYSQKSILNKWMEYFSSGLGEHESQNKVKKKKVLDVKIGHTFPIIW